MDGHLPSLGRSTTIKNMVTNLPEDGHPFSKYGHQPSQGWSTTIQNLPKGSEVRWMVSHHPQNGHPLSKIYQNELYYKLGILHLEFTHKIMTSFQSRAIKYGGDGGTPPWRPVPTPINPLVPPPYSNFFGALCALFDDNI